MITRKQNNSIKKLATLMGLVSASVFLAFPALALINSNSSGVSESHNNGTRRADFTARSQQLLAQGRLGTGQGINGGTNSTTGTGQGNNGLSIPTTGQGNNGLPNQGTGQGNNGLSIPTTGQGNNGLPNQGTGQGNNGLSIPTTGQGNNGLTNQGTGQGNNSGDRTNNDIFTGQQGSFEQFMRIGYTATEQRDYQTALINFRRALQLRPGNNYAVRAIENVEGYIQRQTTR